MTINEKISEHEYSKVSTQENVIDKQEIPSSYGYGVRHVQLLLCLLCLSVNFMARGHMGVTVVAMTSIPKEKVMLDVNVTGQAIANKTTVEYIDGNNKTTEDIERIGANITSLEIVAPVVSTNKAYQTFIWTKSTQEMVLGSFFLGYCIMTFPMGLVVQRWGGKIPLQIALFINGITSVLTPWLTNLCGWKAVCACRVVQGLSQAGLLPSIQNLLAKWVPLSERGTLASYVYTGSNIGSIAAFQLSGILSDSRWGWPSTFWGVGVICFISFCILTIFGSATPTEHKTITEEEKSFIMGRVDDGKVRRRRIPWKAIITSRPMWGALATQLGSGTAFVFFFTQVPSYIHYILGINIKSSGFLTSLPYLASFFTSIVFGLLSDYLTNNKIVSVKNARRIFNTISQIGIALALIGASFTKSTVVAMLCLVVAMGCNTGIHVGWMVNHIDLAPNFSGTLMMMGSAVMNICNIVLPVLVSYVVTDVMNQTQWRILIFIVASGAIITNTIYVILMSAETQPWNDLDVNEEIPEDLESEDNVHKN